MATNNQVNSPLSGQSGTGTFVGVTSPSLTTPDLGVASATSLVFSPTTGGIIGVTSGSNAAAGYVGELISSSILLGSAVSLTTATPANVTSISLTAGDWQVCGSVAFSFAATTTSSLQQMGVSSTSATFGTNAAENNGVIDVTAVPGTGATTIVLNNSPMRFSLSGTTTIYLVAQANFATSTCDAYGFISGRRVR